MPKIKTADGVGLYYEEAGAGTPVFFVHEFAGDYRTWEPQMRRFARSHRCVTYSQRGIRRPIFQATRQATAKISRAVT
jgi:pimeloyl-ACP methyl ester carboxylesterase